MIKKTLHATGTIDNVSSFTKEESVRLPVIKYGRPCIKLSAVTIHGKIIFESGADTARSWALGQSLHHCYTFPNRSPPLFSQLIHMVTIVRGERAPQDGIVWSNKPLQFVVSRAAAVSAHNMIREEQSDRPDNRHASSILATEKTKPIAEACCAQQMAKTPSPVQPCLVHVLCSPIRPHVARPCGLMELLPL